MRPPKLIIAAMLLFTSLLMFVVFLFSSDSSYSITNSSVPLKAGIQKFFSIGPTFSLFPPSALITLTYDNTTSFIASPASFGPALSTDGLKGQIWIGSVLGDDTVDGELGCSDVLGWQNLAKSFKTMTPATEHFNSHGSTSAFDKMPTQSRAQGDHEPFEDSIMRLKNPSVESKSIESTDKDGTDGHLFQAFTDSKPTKNSEKSHINEKDIYADIHYLQEEAEISGKVVLLSRGGCGFLEKLKWAQRRGAIGLIVGDNTKGGPLIQMFAKGDTSSANIPSVFTSYTTAHLLSSLASSFEAPSNLDDKYGKPRLSVKSNIVATENMKIISHRNYIPAHEENHIDENKFRDEDIGYGYIHKLQSTVTGTATWLSSIFFGPNNQQFKPISSRPPSSGKLDWSISDDNKISGKMKPNTQKVARSRKSEDFKSKTLAQSADDFLIGIQDWRDPDLIGANKMEKPESDVDFVLINSHQKQGLGQKNAVLDNINTRSDGGKLVQVTSKNIPLAGGIITPGSGEYTVQKRENDIKETIEINENYIDGSPDIIPKGALGANRKRIEIFSSTSNTNIDKYSAQGLWVTLTPVTGSNPFLDTLLVLVISPLATLTIVYALLLVRSRIKRRRWRAPRSVVERLPVRTYQSIVTSVDYSPRRPSPSNVSATTPLLLNSQTCNISSQMNTDSDQMNNLLGTSNQLQNSIKASRQSQLEKSINHMNQWKKHTGKQTECVVCLEEYIDGVSRVMGLPCGHEFHAECITPWLTTRRRTCPICKGDVVRSMASICRSAERGESYPDNSDPADII
ncbi:PA and RING finger domain-containing protein [Blumeria hordei DH14]|uniref:PA and RING finger domain-containing protein n=1 Tax=Blumeria graminis f. sp. hordei (strain DH14) TaxID=546991 RepID=N1JBQ9_BLUG1|nr:PA and RING finger domain-containing protein [Blumeria hordei DH14]